MLSTEEINTIGQIINTDWGASSADGTGYPLRTSPQHSIKCNLQGAVQYEEGKDLKLIVKYVTVITFRTAEESHVQRTKFMAQAKKLMDDKVKSIKKEYRACQKKILKVKDSAITDSIEMLQTGSSLSPYTQVTPLAHKRAYYRVTAVYGIS